MVKASTFGSEFVAMKTVIKQVEGLCCELCMTGIPINGPTNVFCDNESVFESATQSEATLKKKHNTIAHHWTREAVAAGIVHMAWEDGCFNLAGILTELLPGPRLRASSAAFWIGSQNGNSNPNPTLGTWGADSNLAWLGLNHKGLKNSHVDGVMLL